MDSRPKFDEIGYWSEIKLEILKEYAKAYSSILAAQKHPPLYHIYIDAFAGAGVHLTKSQREFISGSPLNALMVVPAFREYHLIEIEPGKVANLRDRRGLCVLDPYGLDLNWTVTTTAGKLGTLDIFLNFPVADINRNVLWRNPERVERPQIERMNAFWGDESWREIAYRTDTTLFGEPEKEANEVIAEAFRERLRRVAGFARVPTPIPMRNSRGAIVYYLFFASQKNTAEGIVLDIFKKYQGRGES